MSKQEIAFEPEAETKSPERSQVSSQAQASNLLLEDTGIPLKGQTVYDNRRVENQGEAFSPKDGVYRDAMGVRHEIPPHGSIKNSKGEQITRNGGIDTHGRPFAWHHGSAEQGAGVRDFGVFEPYKDSAFQSGERFKDPRHNNYTTDPGHLGRYQGRPAIVQSRPGGGEIVDFRATDILNGRVGSRASAILGAAALAGATATYFKGTTSAEAASTLPNIEILENK